MLKLSLNLGINQRVQLGAWLSSLYIAYKERVLSDTGMIESESKSNKIFRYLKSSGLIDSLVLGYTPEAGSLQVISSPHTYASKLYNLIGTNDAIQTTGTARPDIIDFTPSEFGSIYNNEGGLRKMILTAPITYTNTDKWTFTFIVNWDNSAGVESVIGNYGTGLLGFQGGTSNRYYFTPNSGVGIGGATGKTNKITGKNSIISFKADGNTSIKVYVEGVLDDTLAVNSNFIFAQLLYGLYNNFYGKIHGVFLNNVNLSDANILNYHNFLRTQIEEIETIKIAFQYFAKSNANLTKTAIGTTIPQVTDDAAWAALNTPAWCYHTNDKTLGVIFGKLYNQYAIEKIQIDIEAYNILNPTKTWGYRIAKYNDFASLRKSQGGTSIAGKKLKLADSRFWTTILNADNLSGFSAIGSGYRDNLGAFSTIKGTSFFWTNSEVDVNTASTLYLSHNSDEATPSEQSKKYGMSLRFIKHTTNYIDGSLCVIGDSELSKSSVFISVSSFFAASGLIVDISTIGDTINNQLSKWNALTVLQKSGFTHVVLQIGVNDILVYTSETVSELLIKLQALIDQIKLDSTAKIIVSNLNPFKQGMIDFLGVTDGAAAYIKWQGFNSGMLSLNNIDAVADYHTSILDDGNGSLKDEYNSDNIHINNVAREIVATSWNQKF